MFLSNPPYSRGGPVAPKPYSMQQNLPVERAVPGSRSAAVNAAALPAIAPQPYGRSQPFSNGSRGQQVAIPSRPLPGNSVQYPSFNNLQQPHQKYSVKMPTASRSQGQ